MTSRVGLVTRVALLAALIYVLSWATSYFPGVNAAYFVAFSAGYVWGFGAGAAVGGLGMWLWTSFNPLGPAALPIALAQIGGMAAAGLWGRLFRPILCGGGNQSLLRLWLVLAAAACTATYYAPVALTDAWVFQPFWPRMVANLPFVGISLVANAAIFPLLFGATRRISEREGIS
jgi:hypothetical protein